MARQQRSEFRLSNLPGTGHIWLIVLLGWPFLLFGQHVVGWTVAGVYWALWLAGWLTMEAGKRKGRRRP